MSMLDEICKKQNKLFKSQEFCIKYAYAKYTFRMYFFYIHDLVELKVYLRHIHRQIVVADHDFNIPQFL